MENPALSSAFFHDQSYGKEEVVQCTLNGKAILKLNEDLGGKMRPLDSKTVFIDVVKVWTLAQQHKEQLSRS